MSKKLINYFFYGIVVLLFACKDTPPKIVKITPAFYHWQTNVDLSTTEKRYLEDLSIQKIYPKCFDVDWDAANNSVEALATLEMTTPFPENVAIIPTVFITNRTFEKISIKAVQNLARKISQKLNSQIIDFAPQSIAEIQFDCDWTESTKDKYFQCLKLLTHEFGEMGITLSATIRLHQIKYVERTGVPPVERGILMYYNMGEVQNWGTQNSILDNEIGVQYLQKLSAYPLPLDIALPLFQWGVLYRDGDMIKLINQLKESDLAEEERFGKLSTNTWEVQKNTYLNGYYLYENDKIRIESVALSALKTAATLLKTKAKRDNRTIVFYHLDQAVIEQFKAADLKEIITIFEEN